MIRVQQSTQVYQECSDDSRIHIPQITMHFSAICHIKDTEICTV